MNPIDKAAQTGVYRGRFAPSPTGDLHLGSAATALFCAAACAAACAAGARAAAREPRRAAKSALILRVEDLDRDRVIAACRQGILDDLQWLGLRWDEGPIEGGPVGPYVQSERIALYEEALARLTAAGLTYLCDCSRAEIARAASAPHAGEEGPRYPGTCRPLGHSARAWKRPPAVRLAVPRGGAALISIDDAVLGRITEDVADVTGDFVLRRGDGVFAYQLAVVVDDLAMGITEIVRGADLASSAPRQALLASLLGGRAPRFAHIPLLFGPDGARLAKRDKGISIRDQRASGRDPRDLCRAIAAAYGHELRGDGDVIDALAEVLDWSKLKGLRVTAASIV